MTGMIDAIAAEIARYTGDSGPTVVTEFVVLASFVDARGERRIWGDSADDQRCHQTLGLLAYGTAVESARALEENDDEEEGD
jgi:hypothetical protein